MWRGLLLASGTIAFGLAAIGLVAACSGSRAGLRETAVRAVPYSKVQSVFEKYGCTACHPGVNPSLDLRAGHSYANLVGIRALEDPRLYRVVAGDPGRSFLYLKLGGDPAIADIPAIGSRMPPRAPPIATADRDLIRDWILGGAKGPSGTTGGPQVRTPGSPPTGIAGSELATRPRGTGTIAGTVVSQARRPVESGLVTLLLQGETLEGGEEHYRVAQTDPKGRFVFRNAPAGRFLLKAYAPNTIYVSRIVALGTGQTQTVAFGLANRRLQNPTISAPRVRGRKLSLRVQGSGLDGNYTLAVNPRSDRVFELHNAGNAPGRWTRTIPRRLAGPWVFLAVDTQCNVSRFLTVSG